MSETNEKDTTTVNTTGNEITEIQKDRVGDILRKERINRRITVETIAKDLKLNVKYIKSLEANEYGTLPALPYIKVYLRSLAKYLSLDPEEILRTFCEERGLGAEKSEQEAGPRLSMNMENKESKGGMFIIAVVLIVIVGVFIAFSSKKGWLSGAASLIKLPEQTATTDSSAALSQDSTGITDSAMAANTNSSMMDSANTTTPVDSLHLQVNVKRDSAWLQVYCDGKPWKNVLRAGETKEFVAVDSFNCNVGNNKQVKYTLNGNPVTIKGHGAVAFKVDKNGTEVWPLSKWNSLFQGTN